MKPRNKFQKQVAELSSQLPAITQAQKNWAFKHCFTHIAKRTAKGECTCLECGHTWMDKEHKRKRIICPHCGTALEVNTTRQRVFKQTEYLGIVTTFKGYQVLRFFYMQSYQKKGEQAGYFISEVVQRWMNAQGKSAVLTRLRPMSCWYDTWQFGSNLEIRPDKDLYDIFPSAIYPRQKILPEIKRNGFKGEYHDLTPFELFHSILTNNKAETLLKTKQTGLLRHFVRIKYRNIENYWASLCICIRNGYTITDGSMWCDYVDMLCRLRKDIHSPKYVCPSDLKAEHDRRQSELRKQREKEEREQKRRKAMEDEERFQELKSKFFGISFMDGTIHVHVLESVQEHLEEGLALHHCVFEGGYYLKPQSLVLSATVDGKRIETVEVSLETMKVVQCRGLCNQNSQYHERILKLVRRNMKQIRQRMAA
ncbi:PcfJ-like protein [Porphyromonas gingivalis]|uniref:PcfJ domain-containing protein n=1 Tax=Porphyromonas gingivalis TaxID=837 RepID=UPI000B4CA0ED|nr:PcfJ domain-containing protein [Porphyromonas gingivalis]OWP34390.1 PcfJ-like protein [Porphyromonas gingivalis]